MKRENRFLVLKHADIQTYLNSDDAKQLYELAEYIRAARINEDKRDDKFVCVADDWPEYEPTWKLIEARVKVENCAHEWKLTQVVGDGRKCRLCGFHDWTYDD